MNDLKRENWLKEYDQFLRHEEAVPSQVSQQVFQKVKKALNPSAFLIFAKVFAIHLAVGTLSLSICHQFGLDPFGTKKSLADWFMNVGGHHFCMIGCGILFMGLSILAAGYFLTLDEVRILRKTEILQALCLSLLSLGVFAFMGAQLVLTMATLWLVGALIGGFMATELMWSLRKASF